MTPTDSTTLEPETLAEFFDRTHPTDPEVPPTLDHLTDTMTSGYVVIVGNETSAT